jgi:hypothetical protein
MTVNRAPISTGGGGGGTTSPIGDVFYTVAPRDCDPATKALADYICTGSGSNKIDYLTIQEAINAHDEILLLPGNFYCDTTIFVGTQPGVGDRKTIRFSEGAKINGQSLSLNEPAIQINASNCAVYDPYIEGGGIQGNGIGIKIGSDGLPQPNYVQVFNPEVINANVGVFFGCQTSGGTESTGDCTVHGGRFRQLQTAVHSEGFVNRVNGSFISYCNYGVTQGILRDSGRIDCNDLTINQWKIAAIDIRRGRGSSFHNLWCERTDNSLAPVEVIRLGSSTQTVRDVSFTGTIHLHPGDGGTIEQYVLHLIRCRGLRMDSMEITNELPTVALVRIDDAINNDDNWIGRITCGDITPVGWNYSLLLSNPSDAPIAIDAFPAPAGANPGATIGEDWIASPSHTYTFFRFPGEDRYVAKDKSGNWVKVAADFTDDVNHVWSSGFWILFNSTLGHGVSYLFSGDQFEFNHDWTGDHDHYAFSGWHGLTFEGLGKNKTVIANWRDDSIGNFTTTSATRVGTTATYNFAAPHGFTPGQHVYPYGFTPVEYNNSGEIVVATATTNSFTAVLAATPGGSATVQGNVSKMDTNKDTEPLSFTRCPNITIRHLELFHGGNQDINNSSDALDMDGCTGAHIHDVRVRRARARAFISDGGDTGAVSAQNKYHHNEIIGTPKAPMVSKSANATTSVAQHYRYCMTFVDTVYGESVPGDYTEYLLSDTTKGMSLQFESTPLYKNTDGIIQQKIYRWSDAQPTYRYVATVANTAVSYEDTASDAAIAAAALPPATGVQTVPKEGIKILASSRNQIHHNFILGVGSHGVQIVRKGSDAATNKQASGNIVQGNVIRYPGCGTSIASASGVFAGGGDRNKIIDNEIANPGNSANKGYGVYIQNQDGGSAVGTMIDNNTILDDRNANHPHLLPGMLHGWRLFVAGAASSPDNTYVGFNYISGATSTPTNNGGTNTHQPSEVGHTHAGVDANIVFPRNIAGQYYSQASQVAWTTAADFTMVPNHVYGGSVFFTDVTTIDDMQIEIRTALTTGTKMRFLIFDVDDTNGFWSTLLYESADITITAFTGFKSVNPNLITTAQHRYIFAIVSDSDAAIRVVNPILSTLGFSAPATTPGKLNSLDKAIGTAWQTGSVGPGPAAPALSNNIPLIFVRAST